MERSPRVSFALVVAAVCTGYVSAGTLIPVLPRLVRGPLGLGDVAVGVATAALPVAMLAIRPWVGRLADVRGPRTGVALGLVACVLAAPIYALADSLLVLILARLLHGVGEASIFTSGLTWSLRLMPRERQGQTIGLFGVAVWGGFSVGPLLGEIALDRWGYDAVWLVTGATAALGLVLVARLAGPAPIPAGPHKRALIPRGAIVPGAGLAAGAVGMGALMTFAVLLCDDRGFGDGAVAVALFALTTLTCRLLLGRVPDRLGPRRATIIGASAGSAGLALIAVAPVFALVCLGASLFGVCWSLIFPSLGMLVLERVPASQRGTGLAVFGAFFDGGFALSGPALGVLAEAAGYGAVFAAGAVFTALAMLAVRWTPARLPVRSPPA